MVLYNTICSDLIRRVCRTILNDWISGTATTGSDSTTIEDIVGLKAGYADDYFQNRTPVSRVYILATTDNAAPKGEERKASDYVDATGKITVGLAYSAAVGAGDIYVVTHLKRWAEIKEYLNMAVDLVKAEALVPKIDDTSVTIQSDVYEYALPSGFTHIYRVTQADDNGHFYDAPIDPTHYSIIRSATTPIIHFKKAPQELALQDHYYGALWFDADSVDDRKLRIEGFGLQESLVNDTDICYIHPDFVAAQAGAFIHASLTRRADNEPDAHQTQFSIWQGIADSIRKGQGFMTQTPPNCKRVR